MANDETAPVKLTDITPDSLVEQFGVDPVRYYLLRNTPLGTDGDFSIEGITDRYNADLANNLGNLVARLATVIGSKSGGLSPAPDEDSQLKGIANETVVQARDAWERFAPQEGLEVTWRLIGAINAALEVAEPWKADPGPQVDAVLGSALEALRIVTVLITAAMPDTAAIIWERIGLAGLPGDGGLEAQVVWGSAPTGRPISKGDPLFPRRKD
jgi:methionyl-tRNA synthetase